MKIKMPKSENQLFEDPFLILGYGLNAYFDMMISMAMFCLMVTLFMLPVYNGYAFNDEKGLQNESKYPINQFSIGNLGGSNIFCAQKRVGTGSFAMSCPNGQFTINETSVHLGLMSMDIPQKIFCKEDAIWESNSKTDIAECTDNIDKDALYKRVKDNCDLKKTCSISTKGLLNAGVSSEVASQCGDEAFVYV